MSKDINSSHDHWKNNAHQNRANDQEEETHFDSLHRDLYHLTNKYFSFEEIHVFLISFFPFFSFYLSFLSKGHKICQIILTNDPRLIIILIYMMNVFYEYYTNCIKSLCTYSN